ncbi:ester cyclase [Microbaculum marinum]|uniref:Ester cyclase n=1 Tax=Microbaculum marinum TaxID=1764581 RepID=A0AAW9RW98_9HYPH
MSGTTIVSADSAPAQGNAELVRRFFADVLSPGGHGRIDDFLAEHFVDHDPEPDGEPGRAGVARKLAGFRAAFPDGRFEPEIIVAAGDMVSARSRFVGTQTGAMGPLPASGRTVEVMFHDFYRIADGRITEHWHVFDAAGMMQTLGAGAAG